VVPKTVNGSQAIDDQSRSNRNCGTWVSVASGGKIVPVPGGVLIRDATGEIAGAVGISGDTSENDETCAVHGIGVAGLVADTGDPA
jgi:uncharacterized protein GlcG (DUF336 family)